MSQYDLSEEDLLILDILLNLEPILEHRFSGFWLAKNRPLAKDQLDEIINRLSKMKLTFTQTDNYQRKTFLLKPMSKNRVVAALSDFWKNKGIDREHLLEEAEKNYGGSLKALELKSTDDDKFRIGFSDYYSDYQTREFCEKLWEIGMMFKQTWSSRKHDYEEYFLRRVPFDTAKILEEFVISKLDPEGLRLETDWRVLSILMFSEKFTTVKDLQVNLPDLTSDEINDIVFRLQDRGILTEEYEELKIPKTTKSILKNYFLLHRYQPFRDALEKQLRQRIRETTSNLYLLGLVKKILSSTRFKRTTEPFLVIERDLIKDISEEDLKKAAKLGIIYLTKRELIIAYETLLEFEEIVKSALSEETVYRVPAQEIFTAIAIWKKIFGECKEYIKIEDEYVNEETLEILQSYAPPAVRLTVLSSIKGARDMDVEEMERRVQTIKGSGRKIELFFVGYEHNGEAPFHERYIISKDICYSVSGSLKQVGKSKSISITLIPKEKKVGTVERAFDYWIGAPITKLKEMSITRLPFDIWLKSKLKASA